MNRVDLADVDFLSLIERGRNAPSFETLERIARRLKIPVAELFNFDISAIRRSVHLLSSQSKRPTTVSLTKRPACRICPNAQLELDFSGQNDRPLADIFPEAYE